MALATNTEKKPKQAKPPVVIDDKKLDDTIVMARDKKIAQLRTALNKNKAIVPDEVLYRAVDTVLYWLYDHDYLRGKMKPTSVSEQEMQDIMVTVRTEVKELAKI